MLVRPKIAVNAIDVLETAYAPMWKQKNWGSKQKYCVNFENREKNSRWMCDIFRCFETIFIEIIMFCVQIAFERRR